jgi:RNA-directed DNA polymerase
VNADDPITLSSEGSAHITGKGDLIHGWETIDWDIAQTYVNRLQCRIAKSSKEKKFDLVKRLQHLLTNSFYAKCLAVRKVTTNPGKNTPGIDGEKWDTSAKKMRGVLSLNGRGYKAKPLRRIHIPKKNGKTRPLGIPTMKDRAMQALYALALEPVAETTGDKNSYGFRKERSTHDACAQLFIDLGNIHSPKYVLEGDIKGCFDNISHEWMEKNIPTNGRILKQFLKPGFVYGKRLFPTKSGTPQGGIISPILANMTLDGMEKLLYEKYQRKLGKPRRNYNPQMVNFVRYADDFVITCKDEYTANQVREDIAEFLTERGLELSLEKTLISHIDDGFDFLGWNFRKYKGKLLIKPSEKSVKSFKDKIRETIDAGKAWTQDELILNLNPVVDGWTNYHKHVVSSVTFYKLDRIVFKKLWSWALQRHNTKRKGWVKKRYWHIEGTRNWVFKTKETRLRMPGEKKIVRHVKMKSIMNPFLDTEYFQKRKTLLEQKRKNEVRTTARRQVVHTKEVVC